MFKIIYFTKNYVFFILSSFLLLGCEELPRKFDKRAWEDAVHRDNDHICTRKPMLYDLQNNFQLKTLNRNQILGLLGKTDEIQPFLDREAIANFHQNHNGRCIYYDLNECSRFLGMIRQRALWAVCFAVDDRFTSETLIWVE